MSKLEQNQIDELAYALSCVILNEDNEDFNASLELLIEIQDICKKIVKSLDEIEIKKLLYLRAETAVKAIEFKRKLDDILPIFNE